MRLTVVISSLGMGGAERVLSILANAWADRGDKVTVLTLDDGTAPPFFPLRPTVRVHPLGLSRPSANALQAILRNASRIWALRRAIRKSRPEVVVAFMDQVNILTLLATAALRLPTIVSEHTDPATAPLGRPWRLLRQVLYPRASRLVVATQTAFDYFSPAVRRRTALIPYPVVLPPGAGDPPPPGDRSGRRLIALGRLSHEKGFDLLIRAFAPLAERFPSWTLAILGEGPERTPLEAIRGELGLADQVALPGRTQAPGAEFRQSDLFVMPSRVEGFPNALCEAMACGLPAVSFDCPSGPRAIIRPGVDGVLVPPLDVPALSAALDRLMGDEAERRRLAERAPDVLDRFGLASVLAMWDDVFAGVRR